MKLFASPLFQTIAANMRIKPAKLRRPLSSMISVRESSFCMSTCLALAVKSTSVRAVLMVCALAVFAPACGEAREPTLGIWYEGDPGLESGRNKIPTDVTAAGQMFDRDFSDIAAHNLNSLVVPNSPPAHHAALLTAAQKHGLQVILETAGGGGALGEFIRGRVQLDAAATSAALATQVGPVLGHPALAGIQLIDEPRTEWFGRYNLVAQALRTYAPALQPYCTIIGADKIARFVQETGSEIVLWDWYPVRHDTPAGDIEAMRVFARLARKAGQTGSDSGVETEAVIQAHAITGMHRFPTPAEIRCMTHLAVAGGARGIWWFLYQTELFEQGSPKIMSGLVDADYRGDGRWAEVDRLASELKLSMPLLNELRPVPHLESSTSTTSISQHLLRGSTGDVLYAVNLDTQSTSTLQIAFPRVIPATVTSSAPSQQQSAWKPHPVSSKTGMHELPPGDAAIFLMPPSQDQPNPPNK